MSWWDDDQYEQELGPVGPRAFPSAARRNGLALVNRGRPVRAAKRAAGKSKGKRTAYQAFCAKLMKRGYTMAQAARAWKIHKKGGSPAKHASMWKATRKSTAKTARKMTKGRKTTKKAKTTKSRSRKVPASFKKNQSLGPKAMALAHREGISLKAAWARLKKRK